MAYSFQTFSVNAIFTSSQANQIEVNIRDHSHGAAGVGQTVGAAPTSSGHYANKGYVDIFLRAQAAYNWGFVAGRINTTSSPTILTGSGFGATWVTTAVITVNFSTPFSSAPVVFTCAEGDNTTGFISQIGTLAPTASNVQLHRRRTDTGANEGIIDFVAIGPR